MRMLGLMLVLSTLPAMALAQASPQALRELLSLPDHFVMMRHASAPGFGDPPGMRLDDCGTQRNLSEEGRQEAARVGAALRAAGLPRARVYSSQWCRCLDTARQLALGDVTPLPALNSFFDDPKLAQPQSQALRDWLAAVELSRPVVLVTHQVNMTALTGQVPQAGELFVIRRQGAELRLVTRLPEAALRTGRPVPANYGLPR